MKINKGLEKMLRSNVVTNYLKMLPVLMLFYAPFGCSKNSTSTDTTPPTPTPKDTTTQVLYDTTKTFKEIVSTYNIQPTKPDGSALIKHNDTIRDINEWLKVKPTQKIDSIYQSLVKKITNTFINNVFSHADTAQIGSKLDTILGGSEEFKGDVKIGGTNLDETLKYSIVNMGGNVLDIALFNGGSQVYHKLVSVDKNDAPSFQNQTGDSLYIDLDSYWSGQVDTTLPIDAGLAIDPEGDSIKYIWERNGPNDSVSVILDTTDSQQRAFFLPENKYYGSRDVPIDFNKTQFKSLQKGVYEIKITPQDPYQKQAPPKTLKRGLNYSG